MTSTNLFSRNAYLRQTTVNGQSNTQRKDEKIKIQINEYKIMDFID